MDSKLKARLEGDDDAIQHIADSFRNDLAYLIRGCSKVGPNQARFCELLAEYRNILRENEKCIQPKPVQPPSAPKTIKSLRPQK